jgi:hypothetical protein
VAVGAGHSLEELEALQRGGIRSKRRGLRTRGPILTRP